MAISAEIAAFQDFALYVFISPVSELHLQPL
jgi:hypothetical protein